MCMQQTNTMSVPCNHNLLLHNRRIVSPRGVHHIHVRVTVLLFTLVSPSMPVMAIKLTHYTCCIHGVEFTFENIMNVQSNFNAHKHTPP